jgi:hypothetical protein
VVAAAIAAALLAVGFTVLYGDEWWFVRSLGFALLLCTLVALPLPGRAVGKKSGDVAPR